MHAQNPDPAVTARRAALAVIALIALVALVGAGCSKKITSQLIPNQPPEVRLTAAPVTRDSLRPEFYAYSMQWVGFDPDGRVDHFLLAVDAVRPGAYDPTDTTWHTTARNESTFFFSAGQNYDPINPRDPKGQSPHVISIFAVDNQGAISTRPATRAFFSFTQCPFALIVEPAASFAITPTVTPTVTFKWDGQDPDGQFTTKPLRWVFRLFRRSEPERPGIDYISYALLYPDSVRRQYAPEFAGWTSVGAETTSFQFRNLNPSSTYLFIITGFDEAGAYDPVFENGRNMLKFRVSFAGTSGPIIRMFNQFFDYTYSSGGYDPSESQWFRLEVPADQELTINWIATAPEGADIRRYRWTMDLVDLSDQTPRSNEVTDVSHWSVWARGVTATNLGKFHDNREAHLFFIEAEDNNGLVSLGIINFTVVRSTFEKDLLFVDDTRLSPDFRASRNVPMRPPTGTWPTAAELDTFLFAKGGFPWREYPNGTLSSPGIFNGYAYDTIGTRGISADGTVPLSLLGQYKHLVWYTDDVGATYDSPASSRSTPVTALRLVNSPGHPVVLSTYMTQGYLTSGGKVWLCGGGAAFATLITWNKGPIQEYDSREPNPELRPGRLMYDFAHWREGVQMLPAVSATRFGTPGRHWPPPDPTSPTPLSPPNYSLLPTTLDPKSSATDPLPPLRGTAGSFFYRVNFMAEYIHRATFIREDYDDDPDLVSEFSTLDTLYQVLGGSALSSAPIMTYYHGRENQPMVFSGFNFWYWRRTQCIQLVDWVLQQVWEMTRDTGASRAPSVPAVARQASR